MGEIPVLQNHDFFMISGIKIKIKSHTIISSGLNNKKQACPLVFLIM